MTLKEKFLKMIIKRIPLTYENLIDYGFSYDDIISLRYANLLEYDGDNKYDFRNYLVLYNYGKHLKAINEVEDAVSCYELLYEINPDYYDVAVRLFLHQLENGDYTKIKTYLDTIWQSDKYDANDKLLCVYLLSFLTALDAKYQDIIQNISIKSFENLDNSSFYQKILAQQFVAALKILNNSYNDHLNIMSLVIKKLLIQVVNNARCEKEEVYALVNMKEYDKALMLLEEIKQRHSLNMYFENVYDLLQDLLQMMETGLVLEAKSAKANYVYEAINNKNYPLALYLEDYKVKSQRNHLTIEDSIIYSLLQEINYYLEIFNPTDMETVNHSLDEKLDNLPNIAQDGLILLPPKSHHENYVLRSYLLPKEAMKIFYLGRGEQERLVLLHEHVYTKDDKIDLIGLFQKAEEKFQTESYEEALELFKQALALSGKSIRCKSNLYFKIGYLYSIIPNPNYELSLDYLTVAQMITEIHEDYMYDYRPIMASVKRKMNKQNKLTRKKPE